MKWKCWSLSCVQLFVTLWTPARQAPLTLGIIQARILENAAIPFFKQSFRPRDWTQVFCTAGRFFTVWATKEETLKYVLSIGAQLIFWLICYIYVEHRF